MLKRTSVERMLNEKHFNNHIMFTLRYQILLSCSWIYDNYAIISFVLMFLHIKLVISLCTLILRKLKSWHTCLLRLLIHRFLFISFVFLAYFKLKNVPGIWILFQILESTFFLTLTTQLPSPGYSIFSFLFFSPWREKLPLLWATDIFPALDQNWSQTT